MMLGLDTQAGVVSTGDVVPEIPVDKIMRPPGDTDDLLISVTGPFFLGFALEYLGMGVVLMLGIQYLVALRHPDNRPTPGLDQQSRLGPVLVGLSLFFNLLQTIFDLVRGWDMFALHFMDIFEFATPDYIWFISPFLGLFPALFTQAFLLRRITLFLSSLSSLWPALDTRVVKVGFSALVSAGIIVSFFSGCLGCYYIWKSGPLWHDFVRDSELSRIPDLIWLATSSAVDIVLSVVLSLELWYARRKLATRGGMLAKITWQLLLVTFHGGLAVTALQLTALFLFEYKRAAAFCYLPILFLPKIYTITLLLSLTLPQGHKAGHSASHVFSLPTIHLDPDPLPGQTRSIPPHLGSSSLIHRRSSPSSRIPVLPPLQLSTHHSEKKEAKDKRKSNKSGLSSVVARSWRLSQEWVSWSLLSGEDSNKRASSKSKEEEVRQQNKWKANEEYEMPLTPPDSHFARDDRRPSEPNSIAPLLPLSPRSDLSLNTVPTDHSYRQPYSFSPNTPYAFPSTSSTTGLPGAGVGAGIASPPRSITVTRQHSFSTGSHSHSTRTNSPRTSHFDRENPFSSLPRSAGTGTGSHRRPSVLDPIQSGNSHSDEGERDLEPPPRPGMRPRLMSFEDMLSGSPTSPASPASPASPRGAGPSSRWKG